MRKAIVIALTILLLGCQSAPPPPVTKEVKVAVPVKCAVTVDAPKERLARSKDELWAMISKAPNVTEQARVVSDQLLLWIGYGPKLEVAVQACTDNGGANVR